MAERLTIKNSDNTYSQPTDTTFEMVFNKLGELEDIMEKYGIESVELLEHIIKKGKVINSVIEDFAKEEYDKMKQDRDTWQKACELACKWFKQTGFIGDQTEVDYYYQQAKKEGNDERKN